MSLGFRHPFRASQTGPPSRACHSCVLSGCESLPDRLNPARQWQAAIVVPGRILGRIPRHSIGSSGATVGRSTDSVTAGTPSEIRARHLAHVNVNDSCRACFVRAHSWQITITRTNIHSEQPSLGTSPKRKPTIRNHALKTQCLINIQRVSVQKSFSKTIFQVDLQSPFPIDEHPHTPIKRLK
jgi:hypothetical protein